MSWAAAVWVKCRCRIVRLILTTRPALIRCSPASARPRSANTLPEPGSISGVFLLGIPHLAPQMFEALPDQFHIGPGRSDPPFRFLLKGMDHVDRVPNGDCVYRTPVSALIMGCNFHHAGSPDRAAAWPLGWFRPIAPRTKHSQGRPGRQPGTTSHWRGNRRAAQGLSSKWVLCPYWHSRAFKVALSGILVCRVSVTGTGCACDLERYAGQIRERVTGMASTIGRARSDRPVSS